MSDYKRAINSEGLKLIKNSEGLRLQAYLDAVGVPTIGYGHTSGVQMGQSITTDQAEQFLLSDLAGFESGVSNLVKVKLSENQFAALVSFAFNLGVQALADSTLLRKLNAGDYQGAANEFGRWVFAGGQQLPGLVTRRANERALFLKPDSANPAPPPVASSDPWLLICPSEDWRSAKEIAEESIALLQHAATQLGLVFKVDKANRKVYLGRGTGPAPAQTTLKNRVKLQTQSTGSSCGHCSAAMAINALTGKSLKDTDLMGKYPLLLSALQAQCPAHDWEDEGNFTRSMWASIERSLGEGYPVIMGQNGPLFSPSGRGHVVLLVAIKGDQVTFADPALGEFRTLSHKDFEAGTGYPQGQFVLRCRGLK